MSFQEFSCYISVITGRVLLARLVMGVFRKPVKMESTFLHRMIICYLAKTIEKANLFVVITVGSTLYMHLISVCGKTR